jgi:hypothetical protein
MSFNSAGIYYEQDETLIVESWRNDVNLAVALRNALGKFGFREEDLRDRKKSDWSAYRASSCQSVRDFETSFLRIDVRALNESELFYDASARPPADSELRLHVTLNPYGSDEEIARLLIKLFDVSFRLHIDAPESPTD